MRQLATNKFGHLTGITLTAFDEFVPDVIETASDGAARTRRFITEEDVPNRSVSPWDRGSWARRARLPR